MDMMTLHSQVSGQSDVNGMSHDGAQHVTCTVILCSTQQFVPRHVDVDNNVNDGSNRYHVLSV